MKPFAGAKLGLCQGIFLDKVRAETVAPSAGEDALLHKAMPSGTYPQLSSLTPPQLVKTMIHSEERPSALFRVKVPWCRLFLPMPH